MAVGSSVAPIPVMALTSATGALERSTEPFRERCGNSLDAGAEDPRLLHVLHGQLDRTTLALAGLEMDVEAVLDLEGKRKALLSVRAPDDDADFGPAANALLVERFDSSPAIVWLKDMDGRYLHVNRCYAETLSTSEENLIGRTDGELPAREVVDGPRLRHRITTSSEPLQLEYTVEQFEGRPALAVLRFAVLDRLGDPVAVCGVAAPLRQAHVARAECARIVRMERWSRLDSEAVRSEILDEWGVVGGAPPPDPSPVHADDDTERESLLAKYQAAQAQRDAAIEEARARTGEVTRLQAELSDIRAHAKELEVSLSEALVRPTVPAADSPGRVDDLREELGQLQAQLDQASAHGETAERELAAQRAEATKLRDELSEALAALARAEERIAAPEAPECKEEPQPVKPAAPPVSAQPASPSSAPPPARPETQAGRSTPTLAPADPRPAPPFATPRSEGRTAEDVRRTA